MNARPIPGAVIAIIVALAASASAQTPAKATAAIRGRVVAMGSGLPLRRARITINSPALAGSGRNISTNVDGRYEMKDLPPGRYTISVARGGYLSLRYGQRRPLEQARPLDVLEGQTVEGIDFALPRAGRIAGRVLDETGDPIAGVRVYAMQRQYYQGRRQLIPMATGRTDDSGAYKLTGLDPGAYLIRANARETWTVTRDGVKRTMVFAPTFYPGTMSVETAVQVTVGIAQQIPGADIQLAAVKAATVSGRAVDSRGVPARYVGLAFEVVGPGGGMVGLMGNATVLPDGTFTIKDVPPGEYQVKATGTNEVGVAPVTVDGADVTDVSIVTSPGWTVSGTITTETAAALPFAADRVRVSAPLVVPGPAMGIQGEPRPRSVVNNDWTFQTSSIARAARLRVTVPDGWAVKQILREDRDVADAVLEMNGGETLSGLQIVLTDRLTTLTGRLADGRGAPLTDGTVVVFASDARKWFEGSRWVRAVRPDFQGQWLVKGLPPGDYLAAAIDYVPDSAWTDPEYLESIRRLAQKVAVSESSPGAVALTLVAAPR